ncbi:hypothetical protein DFJ73DRAFT_779922 [Zopfochytrium polystomum]|nr:hypothetical protein DFJ73DRAFT_779922 [Zopfochytrium polystomum]
MASFDDFSFCRRPGGSHNHCVLCGTTLDPRAPSSLTGSNTNYHAVARALLVDGRWSKPGVDKPGPFLTPLRHDLDRTTTQDGPWFRMTTDPIPAVPAGACTFSKTHDPIARRRAATHFSFPFHAPCAAWLDARLRARRVPLAALGTYLAAAFANQESSRLWAGGEYAIAYVDQAGVDVQVMPADLAVAGDDGDEGDHEAGGGGQRRGGVCRSCGEAYHRSEDDYEPLLLRRLRRGAYAGSLAHIPIPQLGPAVGASTTPPASCLSTPHALPAPALEAILGLLQNDTGATGYAPALAALPLLSASRGWYAYARATMWRRLCRRDGFAQVPVADVKEAVAECDGRGIDWKRGAERLDV